MATSSIRVLVVDDSEPFRRVVCSILQNKPELRTIIEASDGVEAIELAQALQPDLILLDIGLPKLNGIEAVRLLEKMLRLVPRRLSKSLVGIDADPTRATLGSPADAKEPDRGDR